MNTKKLLNVLEHFKFVFQANNYIKEANYVIFSPKNNHIRCYSDNMSYVYSYENMEEDFPYDKDFAIEAKKLFALIKKIKQEEISVKKIDDNTIGFRHSRSMTKFSFSTMYFKKYEKSSSINLTPFEGGGLKEVYKTHLKFKKDDRVCANAYMYEGNIVSSDIMNIVRYSGNMTIPDCGISADCLKHVIDNNFEYMDVYKDSILFQKDGFTFMCKNLIENTRNHGDRLDSLTEEVDFNYNVVMSKEEDIDFIDTVLADYQKLDKKITITIKDSERMFLTVDGGNASSDVPIALEKYKAGEEVSFDINVEYFKDVFYNYDYFNLGERALYCVNTEDNVDRAISIGSIKWG